MKIDTLKKKLNTEFNFSEIYETLDPKTNFEMGSILLVPHYREQQRPWMTKAYAEWLKGERTVVLIAPLKSECKYFKKYVTNVAEVRPIKEVLDYNNHRVIKPMIIAVYWRRLTGPSNFTVSFN